MRPHADLGFAVDALGDGGKDGRERKAFVAKQGSARSTAENRAVAEARCA